MPPRFLSSVISCSLLVCGCIASLAQSPAPAIAAVGYTNPFPIIAAPGQLVTLYVQAPAGSNISAVYWNQQSQEPVPVLQVGSSGTGCIAPPDSPCAGYLAVTVQIPFDAPLNVIAVEPTSLAVSINGVQSSYVGVLSREDHVHILTSCDTIIQSDPACAPLILHAHGQPVSWQQPAVGGETLVAYATGLGQTNPPLATGVPAAQSSPALSPFNMDFNYRPNALATQPSTIQPPGDPPLYAGSTQGFIGLYQINFVVPPPPAGLESCSNLNFLADGPVGGLVLSNLTVSVGSLVSFDGAGICVMPQPVLDPPAA